jgi:hypothetical protein
MRPTIHPIHTPYLASAPLADHAPVLVRAADPRTSADDGREPSALPARPPMLAPLPG